MNAALKKYAKIIFSNEIGAFFKVKNQFLEMAVSWGEPYKGDELFKTQECWALRQGEMKVQDPDDGDLKCKHLTSSEIGYAICEPVSTRDGVIGLLSIYIPMEKLGDEKNIKNRIERNKNNLIAISDRLGIAFSNLQLREKLKYESIRDPLTKLFNRRFLDESIEIEIRKSQRSHHPISIILLDADHFKGFNDTYGHDAGDTVLIEIAKVIKSSLRQEDLPCRYGGEEFAIALVGMEIKKAVEKAEEIRKSIEALEIKFGEQNLPKVTVSCGVATIPYHAKDQFSCVKEADKALYRAKEQGRNRVEVSSNRLEID